MKILSIEPTPSPNTMKISLDTELPSGQKSHYTIESAQAAPVIIQNILKVDGVKSVYHVADFLAIDRKPTADWKGILLKVREIFGEDVTSTEEEQVKIDSNFGEVQVFVQMYQDIPMQLKLVTNGEERRAALPPYFKGAVMELSTAAKNVVLDRQWIDYGIRYGDYQSIEKEVVDELTATHPEEKVKEIVSELINQSSDQPDQPQEPKNVYEKLTEDLFKEEDWKKRYAKFVKVNPTIEDLPLLEKALNDSNVSIRRLATAYLGMLKSDGVLPLLLKALKDPAVGVRRIAGDCLSDLGLVEAMPAMIEALKDSNKLVRWRAAMFLFEVGDESAILALNEALKDEPEFEVKMQMQLALQRIENGEEALGSVWKQMTEQFKKEQ